MNVFISHGDIAYEDTHVLGVHSTLPHATLRCVEREFADIDRSTRYHRHFVEEWTLDGDFVRQYDIRDGEAVVVDEVVAADG